MTPTRDKQFDIPFFALVEIFGGAFGILMLLLVAMLVRWQARIEEASRAEVLHGLTDAKWAGKTGKVIELYPSGLRIAASETKLQRGEIRGSEIIRDMAARQLADGNNAVILLVIYPESNDTFLETRNAFMAEGLDTFAWIVLNTESVRRLADGRRTLPQGST